MGRTALIMPHHVSSRAIMIIASLVLSLCLHAQHSAGELVSPSELEKFGVDAFFTSSPIDSALLYRMQKGGSYPDKCPVPLSELRYLRVLHYNYQGHVQIGELVCNRRIQEDLLSIFRDLFDAEYQIEQILLIDEYGADDEASMANNNTSCFCYRPIAGSKQLSLHSQGLAIDINPLQNPCVHYTSDGRFRKIQPDTDVARQFIRRDSNADHLINASDLCYRLFRAKGFTWGGSWQRVRDYQHFQKR